jgi:hypothetical protein
LWLNIFDPHVISDEAAVVVALTLETPGARVPIAKTTKRREDSDPQKGDGLGLGKTAWLPHLR